MAVRNLLQNTIILARYVPAKQNLALLRLSQTSQTSMCFGTETRSASSVKIKGPQTKFSFFVKEKYAEVTQNTPGMKAPQAMSNIAARWRSLSEAEKKKYEELSVQDRARYQQEWQALSPAEKESIKADRSSRRKALASFRERKKIKQLNSSMEKPKRPLGAFTQFLMSKMQPGQGIKAVAGTQKEIWKNMPESEKKMYQEKYQHEYEEYKKELLQWEEKVFFNGYPELVRKATQKKLQPPVKKKPGPKPKPKKAKAKKVASKKKTKKTAKTKTKAATSKTKTAGSETKAVKSKEGGSKQSKEGGSKTRSKKVKVDEDPSWMREE